MSASDIADPLTISPGPGVWRGLVRRSALSKRARATRAALRLPTDRPIIMSGHQAGVWHAGILAKRFALDASSRAFGATPAWLVVDHDAGDPLAVRYPARDAEGVLVAKSVGEFGAGSAPVCRQAPAEAWSLPDDAATREVALGLGAIREALGGARGEAMHAGEQAYLAVERLLRAEVGEARAVWSSRLHATPAFEAVLQEMGGAPERAHETYNAAVRGAPGAGVRELGARGGDREMPVWRLTPAGREPVFASELASIARADLAPRALLMTLLVRRDVCDLFIHGLGGGASGGDAGYDRATEVWAQAWLGEELAPAVAVSATRLAAFPDTDLVDRSAVARAVALAHRARHNPRLLGDAPGQAQKAALLARIDTAKHEGRSPASSYAEMHGALDEYRRARAGELEALRREAGAVARRAAARDVALDRTWAFPLLGGSQVRAMRAEIADAFASA